MSEEFDGPEIANELINRWLQETRGLPITLQLTKLGFAVIEGLEKAFELGREEGYEQQLADKEAAEDAYWEHIGDELSGSLDKYEFPDEGEQGEVGPDDSGIRFDGPDDDDTNEFEPF